MKKYPLHIISFFMISFLLSACFLGPSIKGSGKVEKEKRSLDDFSKVKASEGLEVILISDLENYAIVEADDNLMNVIETEVSGNQLKIYTHERIRQAASKKVEVHYVDLEEIHSSSGAMLWTDGPLKSKRLELSASSGSNQKVEIICGRLRAKTSSGAHMNLEGKSTEVDLKASSGSHLKASDLRASDCEAEVSSGAHIYIQVDGDFEGDASSGGHIFYSGNPKNMDIHTSSGGSIAKQ